MAAADNYGSHGTVLIAAHLSAEHIGATIRFLSVDADTDVWTVTEAELCRVNHTESQTTVRIGNRGAQGHDLAHNVLVTVNPVPPLHYVFSNPPEVKSK